MTPLDPTRPFRAADFLSEARRRLPELADELATCEHVPVSLLADAVVIEMTDWVREAMWDVDRDVALRIFDLWFEAAEQPHADPELARVITVGLGVLRVCEQPYGREVAARASPRMRSLMERAPQMVRMI